MSLFFKVEKESSIRVFIIFSSANMEPGKFLFYRSMQDLDGSKIFINDKNNGWYLNGIPEVSKSVEDAVSLLISAIKSLRATEIIFLGSSMGGFGAMMYCSLIAKRLRDVTIKCISLGGAFIVYGDGTPSNAFSRIEKNPKKNDIRKIISEGNVDIIHLFGDDDIADHYQAYLGRNMKNIQRYRVTGSPHSVPKFISDRMTLSSFILSLINDGNSIKEFSRKIDNEHSYGLFLQKGDRSLSSDAYGVASKYLSKALEVEPSSALAHHKLGICLANQGDWDSALNHQVAATTLDPLLDHAFFHKGMALSRLSRENEAFEAYNQCYMLNPRHLRARFSLAKVLFMRGQYAEAEKHLDVVIADDYYKNRASYLMKDVLIKNINRSVKKLASL